MKSYDEVKKNNKIKKKLCKCKCYTLKSECK